MVIKNVKPYGHFNFTTTILYSSCDNVIKSHGIYYIHLKTLNVLWTLWYIAVKYSHKYNRKKIFFNFVIINLHYTSILYNYAMANIINIFIGIHNVLVHALKAISL